MEHLVIIFDGTQIEEKSIQFIGNYNIVNRKVSSECDTSAWAELWSLLASPHPTYRHRSWMHNHRLGPGELHSVQVSCFQKNHSNSKKNQVLPFDVRDRTRATPKDSACLSASRDYSERTHQYWRITIVGNLL